jgi:hypothetical protein
MPGVMISVMARQTTVTVTDDLDGSDNAKEVTFGWDGSWWTIDLNAKNRASLEKALKPYLAKATKQSARAGRKGGARRAGSSPGPGRGSSRGDLGEVRAWAKSNGHRVSDRGRIAAAVQQAYDAAH